MQYLLLFLEGMITFISPCLLPMLPVYISFFAAGEVNNKKTLVNALGFVSGFTIVFIVLGLFAGAVGGLLRAHAGLVNLITGSIVVILGLNFMGVIKVGFLNYTSDKNTTIAKNLRFSTSVLFGAVFSIGWTPCVGAFLGSALLLASLNASAIKGAIMLLVYSLGLGIPFIASALLINKLKDAFDFIKQNYKMINLLSGGLLVVLGILMMTGTMGYFLSLLNFRRQ